MSETEKSHGAGQVHVCPDRDVECGSNPSNWCWSCPQRLAVPLLSHLKPGCYYVTPSGKVMSHHCKDAVMTARQLPPAISFTIGSMLADAMNTAAANGANSVSMPDSYVELAAWLSGITPPAPASNSTETQQSFVEILDVATKALKRAYDHVEEITTMGGKYSGLSGAVVVDSYAEAAAIRKAVDMIDAFNRHIATRS